MWTIGFERRSEAREGTFDLRRDATLRVHPGRSGVAVRAEGGWLLVTQAGDPEDHVLAPGESAWFPRGGLVVALALDPARVVVSASAREAPRRLEPRVVAAA